jgi:hypothetical protein
MANTPENQLIEALKKVDAYGDIAPPGSDDHDAPAKWTSAVSAVCVVQIPTWLTTLLTSSGQARAHGEVGAPGGDDTTLPSARRVPNSDGEK